MKGLNSSAEDCKIDGGIGPEVQPDCWSTAFNIKVSHGRYQLQVVVPSNSTFGDLKSVIVQTIGLEPGMYKLLFRGKVKEDDEDLKTAGVKENSKVVLMEDMTCMESSPEEVNETTVISRGDAAVAAVRREVDILAEEISSWQAVVDSGTKVGVKGFIRFTEMLMRQLLKLDAIDAEGDGKVQRKMEVRRVQSMLATVDILKSRNSNLLGDANSDVSPSTQWETVESGCESMNAASPVPSSAPVNIPSSSSACEPSSTPIPVSPSVPSSVQSSVKFANLEGELHGVSENHIGSINGVTSFELFEAEKPHIEKNVHKKPKNAFEPPPDSCSSSESSAFCPRAIKAQAEQVLLKFYWKRICQKIMETPFEELSVVRPAIDDLIMEMKIYMRDTSSLEGRLISFFEIASDYVKTKLILTETQETHEKSLFLAQQDLFGAEALESERVSLVNDLKEELFQIISQREELKARLAELINKEERMNSALHEAKKDLFKIQQSIADKRMEVLELVDTPYLCEKELDALEKTETLLEESRQDLMNFDLFA